MFALRSGFVSSFVLFVVVVGCGSSDGGGGGSPGSTGGTSGSTGTGGLDTGGNSPGTGGTLSAGGTTGGTGGLLGDMDGGVPEPPMSNCISMTATPSLTCAEVCTKEGKTCRAECHAEQLFPAEVAYYLDQASCERDKAYAFGNANTCGDALGSSLLTGIVTYARCCCR